MCHFPEPGELDGFNRAVLRQVVVKISICHQSHLDANTGQVEARDNAVILTQATVDFLFTIKGLPRNINTLIIVLDISFAEASHREL
jgi:hypothetical protein